VESCVLAAPRVYPICSAAMLYRTLGKTGWKVSAIGFGAWGIGGQWGTVAADVAHDTIKAAHDAGINFFDTADIYGEPEGRSEELIGDALRPVRDRVILATKVGNWGSRYGQPVPMKHPANIELCCDASLHRLKTDYIDLYQCHMRFPPDVSVFLEAFERLVRRGKIRAGGISTDSAEVVERFNRDGTCAAVQLDYNILDRSAETALLPYCQQNNIGVIARRPLATGLAAGKFTPTTRFSDSIRAGWNDGEEHKEFLKRVQAVERLRFLERPGRTMAQAALQFVISHPAVTVAIPGAKTADQARANAAAGGSTITADELNHVRTLAPVRQPAPARQPAVMRLARRVAKRVLGRL
jgi:myo-inositol catabolism protein IolS